MRQTTKNVSPMSNKGRNAYVIRHITKSLLALLEKFISKRKVIHIILTFCRENGANTTFLIKSHDTKKVGITILIKKSG